MLMAFTPIFTTQTNAQMANISEEYAAAMGLEYYTAWFHISTDGYDAYDWLSGLSDCLAHNLWAKDTENNEKAKDALLAWRILKFNISSEVDFAAEEKALYESLIFDMLLGDNDTISSADLSVTDPYGDMYTDTVDLSGAQLANDLYKVIFDICGEDYQNDYDIFIRQIKNTTSDAGKDILYEHLQETLDNIKNNNNLKSYTTIIENILDLISYGVDIVEAIERITKYYAMIELDKSTFDVLYQMSQSAGNSKSSQKVAEAAYDMWSIYNERSNEIEQIVIGDLAKNKVYNIGTQVLWEGLGKKLPLFIGVDIGQKVGTFAANLLTGTEALGASLYALDALEGIEKCLNDTLNYYRTQFAITGSLEDAKAFNAAARMYTRFIESANEYARQHVEVIFKDGIVNSIYGYFHKDEYNKYQSFFDTMEETIGSYEYDARAARNYYWYLNNVESYTITYNANGGTNYPSAQENTGSAVKVSNVAPYRVGYVFQGWSENKYSTTADYAPGTSYTFGKRNVTLYAIWKAGTFDIVFHANGGEFSDDSTSKTLQKTYLQNFTINLEQPTREGYKFTGVWALYADGSGNKYTHGNTYNDIGGAGLTTKHLYAVWQDIECVVEYDYNDNTGNQPIKDIVNTETTPVYSIKEPIKDKANFKGWMFQDPNGAFWWTDGNWDNGKVSIIQPGDTLQLTGDITLYAKWDYYVHYDHGTGYTHDVVRNGQNYIIDSPTYKNGDKVFEKWKCINSNGTISYYVPGDTVNLTSDMKLVAIWIDPADILSGDINGDGKINNNDLYTIQKYLAGDTISVVNEALDVDGNGTVDNADFTRLHQYLSGYNVRIYP